MLHLNTKKFDDRQKHQGYLSGIYRKTGRLGALNKSQVKI